MNTNENNPLSPIVGLLRHIMDLIARSLVVFFDGIKDAVDHASPSLFALVATVLPFILPLPVAFMTSNSAQKFFGWEPWAANVLGFGLEGLGLLAWVKLVDAILGVVESDNRKITLVVLLYGTVAIVYELLLLFVNVVLAGREGADQDYMVVLAAICLLPALSAMLYAHHKMVVERQLAAERNEGKDLAERIRQEQRADRKEARAMKLQQHQQYAAGTSRPTIELKEGMEPFRAIKPFPHQNHAAPDDPDGEQPRKRRK